MYRTIRYDASKTNIHTCRSSRPIRGFYYKKRRPNTRCSKSKNTRLQHVISSEVTIPAQRKSNDVLRFVFKIKNKNEKIISELFASLCRLQLCAKRSSWIKYDLFHNRQRKNYVESVYSKK